MSTAENKALVRQYFEVFHNERQLDLGEQILGSELLAPTLGLAAMLRTAFPITGSPSTINSPKGTKSRQCGLGRVPTGGNGRARSDQCQRRAKQCLGPERRPCALPRAGSQTLSAATGTTWGSCNSSVHSPLPHPGRGPEDDQGRSAPRPRRAAALKPEHRD